MSDSSDTPQNESRQRAGSLDWCSWPLRDDRVRAATVIFGLLLTAVLVGFLSGRAFLGILAAGAIVLSMWRFFLPVAFEADHRGLSQRLLGRRRYIPWKAVKRHQICTAGVLLLSQRDDDRMAPLRGLYVPCDQNRQQLLDLLENYSVEAEHGQAS